MDKAAFEVEINEHIQRLQDLNKQMGEIGKKIGSLQEEGRALHGLALEVKGAIEALAKLRAKQEEKEKAKADSLILPDKALVAADGKTIIAAPESAPNPEDLQGPNNALTGTTDVKPTETMPLSGSTVPVALEVK